MILQCHAAWNGTEDSIVDDDPTGVAEPSGDRTGVRTVHVLADE